MNASNDLEHRLQVQANTLRSLERRLQGIIDLTSTFDGRFTALEESIPERWEIAEELASRLDRVQEVVRQAVDDTLRLEEELRKTNQFVVSIAPSAEDVVRTKDNLHRTNQRVTDLASSTMDLKNRIDELRHALSDAEKKNQDVRTFVERLRDTWPFRLRKRLASLFGR